MAGGKIELPHFQIEVYDGTVLSQWYEAYTGFEVMDLANRPSNATLRRVDRNVYHVYLALLGEFTAGQTAVVGHFKPSFFDNYRISGYIPAGLGGNSDNQWPATARISGTSGDLSILPSHTVSYVYVHGFFLRREGESAT